MARICTAIHFRASQRAKFIEQHSYYQRLREVLAQFSFHTFQICLQSQLKCFLLLYYSLSLQHVSALMDHLQIEYSINYVVVVKDYNKVLRNISVAIAGIFKKNVVILTQQDAPHKTKIKFSLLASCLSLSYIAIPASRLYH
jgi:hypothetical protein